MLRGCLRRWKGWGREGVGRGGLLVVPGSARGIEVLVESGRLTRVWGYRKHLNLDDIDFGDDGVVETVKRVVGKRGIVVYEVVKDGCGERNPKPGREKTKHAGTKEEL
ncbi:alpha 1,2 mannosyltransferase [Arthrobotrys megalospora]